MTLVGFPIYVVILFCSQYYQERSVFQKTGHYTYLNYIAYKSYLIIKQMIGHRSFRNDELSD